MREFDASLSVYERFVLLCIEDAAKEGGRFLDPAKLLRHFPPGHGEMLAMAVSRLAGLGLVQRTGGGQIIKAEGAPELAGEFEEWWSLYPVRRRQKKAKCLPKYVKARQSGVTREQMFDGLAAWKAFKDWQKDGGEYVMGPEVWLNGQCWDDRPNQEVAAVPVLRGEAPAGPWLSLFLKHVEDPAAPKGWEVVNYAHALGLGDESQQAAWVLKKDGPVGVAEWAWNKRRAR